MSSNADPAAAAAAAASADGAAPNNNNNNNNTSSNTKSKSRRRGAFTQQPVGIPPPNSGVLIPGAATATMDPDDPLVWTPDEAVERLLWLEGKGWRYHELRKKVVDMLSACDNPPAFAVACLERVVAERERYRAEKMQEKQHRKKNVGAGGGGGGVVPGAGDGAADPLVHLLLECLPKASGGIRETYNRAQLDAVVKRSRFTAFEDRAAALPLIMRSMSGHLATQQQRRREGERRRREGEEESGEKQGEGEGEGAAGEGAVGADAPISAAAILEPRAVVRLAETYGVDLADVASYAASTSQSNGDTSASWLGAAYVESSPQSDDDTSASVAAAAAVSLVEMYAEALLQEARYAPAITTVLHFCLRRFASREVGRCTLNQVDP
jgi:hypothetical protein